MNPFDQAWALLKWQSPLRDAWGKRRQKSRFGTSYGGFGIPRALRGEGENSKLHAINVTSPHRGGVMTAEERAHIKHGPVTHYHGTYAMDKVADEGLKASVMPKHRAVETPEHLQDKPLVFTTTDWNEANDWAQQRAKQMGTDPGNWGVVGIRGQDLDFAERPDEEKSQFSTADIHVGDIPQEKIVPFHYPRRGTF
tara:strand:- start:485 stop:1072 length:588 start_codon:yes stop_codon:yes gene_type:complete